MLRALAVLVLFEVVASAQPTPDQAVQAKQLWEDGRKLAAAGKYQQACDEFTKSYTLDPAIGTELNLGDCHEKLGHLAIAYHLFDDAAKKDSDADRVKFARGRADALTPRLAMAIVKVPDATTAGLVLKVGGQLVPPAAEVRAMVDPGAVQVELDTPGHPPETRSQPAKAGETITIDFSAAPPTAPTVTAVDQPAGPTDTVSVEKRTGERVRIAKRLVIGGGGLVVVSAGIAVYAKIKYDDQIGIGKPCNPDVRHCTSGGVSKLDSAISTANVATYVGLLGLAAVVAGGIVYFTTPKEFVVAPAASAQGGGITLSGTF